jgi:hypothetical protein
MLSLFYERPTTSRNREVTSIVSSILVDIKKVLGIAEDYTDFDVDIIMHINSVFDTLNQLGVGPEDGFAIEDATAVWDDFLGADARVFNSTKTYIYLRVRLLFDPPSTSFVITSMNEQIQQLEWRINVQREGVSWTDPLT